MRFLGRKAFTLTELMVVASIVGLLASIALPKFAGLIVKAKEAEVKGHLGTLRSAVSIYYANSDGMAFAPVVPTIFFSGKPVIHLYALTPTYLDKIPSISVPGHHPVRGSHAVGALGDSPEVGMTAIGYSVGSYSAPSGRPRWVYLTATGQLSVFCTHTDSTNHVWSEW